MALELRKLQKRAEGGMYASDIRLYISRDDRLCGEGDPEAAFLLVAAGSTLSAAEARRYGLILGSESTEVPQVEEKEPLPEVSSIKKPQKKVSS